MLPHAHNFIENYSPQEKRYFCPDCLTDFTEEQMIEEIDNTAELMAEGLGI